MIQAAINGTRTRAEHPGVPITPEEIARAARDSARAGAASIHLHVRDKDGRESLADGDVARAVRAIRFAVPGTPAGVSTGAWIVPDPEARARAVSGWTMTPDFASVNFNEEKAVALAALLLARGIAVEAGVSSVGAAEVYTRSDLAPSCLRILLEPQEQEVNAALATVAGIETVLDRARLTLPRLLHGTERTAWPLLDAALAGGHPTRMGLEDTLLLPDGRKARNNAALLAEASKRLKGWGR